MLKFLVSWNAFRIWCSFFFFKSSVVLKNFSVLFQEIIVSLKYYAAKFTNVSRNEILDEICRRVVFQEILLAYSENFISWQSNRHMKGRLPTCSPVHTLNYRPLDCKSKDHNVSTRGPIPTYQCLVNKSSFCKTKISLLVLAYLYICFWKIYFSSEL